MKSAEKSEVGVNVFRLVQKIKKDRKRTRPRAASEQPRKRDHADKGAEVVVSFDGETRGFTTSCLGFHEVIIWFVYHYRFINYVNDYYFDFREISLPRSDFIYKAYERRSFRGGQKFVKWKSL